MAVDKCFVYLVLADNSQRLVKRSRDLWLLRPDGACFLGWLRLKLLHLLCAKLNPKGHHLTYRTKKTLRTWKFSTFAPAKRVHHDIDLFFLSFCFRTSNWRANEIASTSVVVSNSCYCSHWRAAPQPTVVVLRASQPWRELPWVEGSFVLPNRSSPTAVHGKSCVVNQYSLCLRYFPPRRNTLAARLLFYLRLIYLTHLTYWSRPWVRWAGCGVQ